MKRTYVPPSGNRSAKLGAVGEQPGFHEVRARPPQPFIGPAGRALDECFAMNKIVRRTIYFTNVIKDLDQHLSKYIYIDKKGNSTIHPEGYQYIQELGKELSALNLNCVLAFGNIPLLALTNRTGITKWRGSVLESTLVPGLKVVPAFHPATIIPPKCNYLNKPLICEDIARAYQESQYKEFRRQARDVTTNPTFSMSVEFLKYIYEAGLRGQTIGIDIEVINGVLDCIAFSWGFDKAICIPFKNKDGEFFTLAEEDEVMLQITRIIEEPRIAKVGANFIFDMQFMFRHYGIRPRGMIHCTQIAQKISYPDYPAGLDFVTTMYTDVPYYKQDGKQWMKMGAGTWEEWWNYNGMDAIIPVEAFPKQFATLKKQGNELTYKHQRDLIEPLMYMGERGIRVDVAGMIEYRGTQEKKLEGLAEELNREVGYDINYNSPQQLMEYFYNDLGIKPYKKRNTQGKYVKTADVDALKRLFRGHPRASKAARIMLDIRSLTKRISTYLNVGKVDKDGRYRSSYKPVGTETGRLSSGKTIFGTGGNQQNWPHDLLRFFLFDEGFLGYSIDLSQIENRIVAYVGGVIPQIEAFERGIDLHRLTASIIFGKPYDEISNVDGSSDLGDGMQSERYWGKKGNHAINYDVGYKKFALVNEMREKEAQTLLNQIHRGFPQIRNGYQATIQNMLRKDRTITNLFGRTRLFLGPVFPSQTVKQTACDATFREGYAQLAQSTCADKINRQGVNFVYYNQDMFRKVELLTQIHDSIVFQIPLTESWDYHARVILAIKESLEQPLTWHDTKIATPCDIAIGFNMCKEDMIELKSAQVPYDTEDLANKLKDIYNELRNE